MAGFVKLHSSMLRSTIWFARPDRELFITALLMAEPREITEPTPQLEARSLKETGWVVPPGWYGFCETSGPGLVHVAGIDAEEGMAALDRLGSPEPESRSRAFEGRRLVRVDGGYIALNYDKYREKDVTSAERSARYRNKKRASSRGDATDVTRDVTLQGRSVTQAEAEAEAEAEADLLPAAAKDLAGSAHGRDRSEPERQQAAAGSEDAQSQPSVPAQASVQAHDGPREPEQPKPPSAVNVARLPTRRERATTEASNLPIGELAKKWRENPTWFADSAPQQRPELVDVARAWHAAVGLTFRGLGHAGRDRATQALLHLYADNVTTEELLRACDAAKRDDRCCGRAPWRRDEPPRKLALANVTLEVVRRLLDASDETRTPRCSPAVAKMLEEERERRRMEGG